MLAMVGADLAHEQGGQGDGRHHAAATADIARNGTATTAARMSNGGLTSRPRKMTTPISAMRRPTPVASTTSALTSRAFGCPVRGGMTVSVVCMTATVPQRVAHLVRVGP